MIKLLMLATVTIGAPKKVDTVVATTYKLTPQDQGIYGNKLASGKRINVEKPHSNRIIAVSRDLLKHYPFHTKVKVMGVGRYSGIYTVEDVMAPRWTKKIDILINLTQKHDKFNRVKLIKL